MSLVSLDTATHDLASIVHSRTPSTSGISDIREPSHPFDAYRIHRSLERMRIVASRVWETRATSGTFAGCDVDDLRTALYLTQRGWHGSSAVEVDVGVEWELVEAIDRALGRDD